MKEDAANGESSKGRHVTHFGTGSRRYDFEPERDHYNCDGVSNPRLELHTLRRERNPDTPLWTMNSDGERLVARVITRQFEISSARTADTIDI